MSDMLNVFHSWRQSYGVVLFGTLAVVASADWFLYDHRIGWTAAIVAAVMLAVLCLRDTTFLRLRGGRVTWLAAIGLLVALVEQPTWLNVTYTLVAFATLGLINAQGWDNDFVRWLGRLLRWAATGWTRLFLDNGVVMHWLIRRGLSPTLARGVAAWIIPMMLTSVFIAIFAWANPVISGWFSSLGEQIDRLISRLPELLNVTRVLFWLASAVFAWSLLRSRVSRRRKLTTATPPPLPGVELVETLAHPELNLLGFPASMVIRCLVLFNIVFLVENVLDTRFLFFDKLPAGVTYTEYVHRGAYPLVAAALLAGAFVLVTFIRGSETESSPWARRLVYLWIAQTVFLTLSAAWRLVRYVEMSSLTRWRVASAIWFGLVALGLCYIVWRIVRSRDNRWLINVNALTALLVLYPCCFINFDGMIARFNARHCAEAGGSGLPLDIEYFDTLGTAALPALDSVKDKLAAGRRRDLASGISQKLHQQLRDDVSDWHAWTWRRHRTAVEVNEDPMPWRGNSDPSSYASRSR